MKKVVILYKFLPHWRIDFFDKLKISLLTNDIKLELIYGKLSGTNSAKKDEVTSEWGKFVANKFIKFGNIELIWQPVLNYIKDADLVIVEQANKLIINYFLIFRRLFFGKIFAFWGHGLNLQVNPNSISNRFKRIYSNQTDWWFAYTEGVKQRVIKMGFPEEKISILNNTIDTSFLIKEYNNVTSDIINNLKQLHHIGNGPMGLYCGGMYKEKRLDFLLEACEQIRVEINDFEIIFIGGGPEEYKIKKAAKEKKWIHYIGPTFNEKRVPFFFISDVFLMPDAIGLAIIDTFVMETPMITTNFSNHGPEIEYLENGINGIMTENNVDDYSQEIINLFSNSKRLTQLKVNCKKSAKCYPLENMITNFKNGILKCLET